MKFGVEITVQNVDGSSFAKGEYVKNQRLKQNFYPMPQYFIGYYISL